MEVVTYSHGIPSDNRFIQVAGEDGTFYDLVKQYDVKEHIAKLKDGGYTASVVRRNTVPPCRFRDFTNGLNSYRNGAWLNGTELYFTCE